MKDFSLRDEHISVQCESHSFPNPRLRSPTGLLEEFSDWLAASKPLPSHLLRFMTHLLLFFRSLGLALKVSLIRSVELIGSRRVVLTCRTSPVHQEEVCVDVLKAYVALLIRDQQTELVASYVSELPAEVATAQYATFLETVTQPELRPRCLQLAIDAGEAAGRE